MLVERKACCHVANAILSRYGAILAHIQAENLQNVREMRFWEKDPGVTSPNLPFG